MGGDIERGVNFASGGSGILDATGEVEVSLLLLFIQRFFQIFLYFSLHLLIHWCLKFLLNDGGVELLN